MCVCVYVVNSVDLLTNTNTGPRERERERRERERESKMLLKQFKSNLTHYHATTLIFYLMLKDITAQAWNDSHLYA